jgi:hypothetical protein
MLSVEDRNAVIVDVVRMGKRERRRSDAAAADASVGARHRAVACVAAAGRSGAEHSGGGCGRFNRPPTSKNDASWTSLHVKPDHLSCLCVCIHLYCVLPCHI